MIQVAQKETRSLVFLGTTKRLREIMTGQNIVPPLDCNVILATK